MATEEQRVTAICDALVNQASTPAQRNRLGTALATEAGRLAEYQAATNAAKARIFLDVTRRLFLNIVRSTEATSAANSAAVAAAANAEASLPETP